MKKKKKKWIIVGIAGVLVLGALGAAAAASRGMSKRGVKVRTAKVERGRLVSLVTANGRIEARRKVEISANVPGQIVNLAVREGDVVKKGDFLLQIDRTSLQADYDSSRGATDALFHERDAARAAVERARLELDRARVSVDSGLISRAEYDFARTGLEQATATHAATEKRIDQARAMMRGARDTLGKTTLTAPMDGTVTRLAVEEGEVAVIGTMNNPGTVLLTISDMSEIQALMEVDETDVPQLKVGQKGVVTIDAYPNREFAGEVVEVASSPLARSPMGGTDAEGIDFEVKIRLAEPPESLKPGLSVSATVTTGEKTDVLAVPLQALAIREKEGGTVRSGEKARDEEGVFVVDAGKVRFVPIATGMTGELDIEVTTGLSGGEEIVTGPFRTLRELKDASPVRVDNTLPRVDQKES